MDSRLRTGDRAGPVVNMAVSEDLNKQANLETITLVTKREDVEETRQGRITTWINSSVYNASPYYSNVHPSLGCSI